MFGYDIEVVDFCFDKCYFVGIVYDFKGKVVIFDDGIQLEYFFWKVDVDIFNIFYEKIVGVWMKKYVIDEIVIKDGKLMENDIVFYCYVDVLFMKSEVKVCNGENGDEELNFVCFCVNVFFWMVILVNLLVECQLEFVWEGWCR